MRNVILTGATGYLGSHILRSLLDRNYKVIILKRTFSDVTRIKKIINKVQCFDIDHVSLGEIFSRIKEVSVIIHASTNYNNGPASTILRDNVLFPLELISHLALSNNSPVFINIDTFFSKKQNIGDRYLEYYKLSKRNVLEWLKMYSCQVKIINFRLEHVFGAGDSENKFVNDMVLRLVRNDIVIDLTCGEQKRDFIYIDDAVTALSCVMGCLDYTSPGFTHYDIGHGRYLSIKEFVIKIKEISRAATKLNFGAIPYRENEIFFSKADRSSINKTGWKPYISIEDGIKRVVNDASMREKIKE